MIHDFTDSQFWQTAGIIIGICVGGGTAVYGIFRKTYCKGKIDKGNEDKVTNLNKRMDKIEKRIDELTSDIQKYRDNNTQKLDKIIENQTSLSNDISYIKGKMSKRDKSTST